MALKAGLRHCGAFTLVEVLAVLVIIASLAAIVFPVFSRVKSSAKKVVCISNLHQLGIAEQLYLADYDDTFPKYVNGIEKLDPDMLIGGRPNGSDPSYYETPVQAYQSYVKDRDVWRCPADDGNPIFVPGGGGKLYLFNGGTSYFFTDFFEGQTSSSISNPSEWIYGIDGSGVWHYTPTDQYDSMQRADSLFADGHVKNIFGAMPTIFYSQYNPGGS